MKLRKLSAGIVAAALAATSCAMYASAAVVTKMEPITLDAADVNMVQWDANLFPDEINEVTMIGKVLDAQDGWYGGGGGFGWDIPKELDTVDGTVDGWNQVDFNMDNADIVVLEEDGSFTATFKSADYEKVAKLNKEKEGAIVQWGWWWGSGIIEKKMQIDDLLINGVSVMGNSVAAAATTSSDVAAAGDTTAATDSTKAGSPDTGVEDVAVVAGLGVVAAGALVVAKKRK